MEEACTVWEGVLIDQKEESTSTDMPLGTAIHNIEITLGKGGQLARAAGAVAKLIAKEGKSATLKLPSGEVRLISKNCSATVGQVGNAGVNQKSLGRAGSKCWLGKRPVVRGVVMNPVDHPHGGGEGRAPIGRKKPATPWGYPALGRRSRKRNKYSDNSTIPQARQLVNHRHILVNGSIVDIPSYRCKPRDIITAKDEKKSRTLIQNYLDSSPPQELPKHLTLQPLQYKGLVNQIIDSKWVSLKINELLVVEYYSRQT